MVPVEIAVAIVLNVSPIWSMVVKRAPSSTVAICLRNDVSASPRPTAMTVTASFLQASACSIALSFLPQMPSVRTTVIPMPGLAASIARAVSSGLASVPLPTMLTLRSSIDASTRRGSLSRSWTTLILSPNPTIEKYVSLSPRVLTKSRMDALAFSSGSPLMLLERSTQIAMFFTIGSSDLLSFGLPPIHLTSSSIGLASTESASPSWLALMLTTPFSS